MSAISVEQLSMTFRVPVRESGFWAAATSLWHRRYRHIDAVRGISFDLDSGEMIGFLGPNGAGKTTTLKMLSGILRPTAGAAHVLGFRPWQRERAYLQQIAMVRGSRPLPAAEELTVLDALRFQGMVYDISAAQLTQHLGELNALLDLEPLLRRQVRALSLGERMRCGLAWSLLYWPRILFLDEPTIGLDVTAVAQMRRFIQEYNRQAGATVILTSHNMQDVEMLCRRVILIDHGSLIHDGPLSSLTARSAPYKRLVVTLATSVITEWSVYGTVEASETGRITLRVPRAMIPEITARLLAELPITDLAIEEPPLDAILDQIYRDGVAA